MADEAADDGGIEILSKAGAIIDALTETKVLTVSAIADAVEEPTSSTYRLLQSLIAMGWVDPAPARGTYRLGLACMQIGGVLEDSLDVRGLALPRMRALRSTAGVAALLCYRRGTRAVCVERIEGHDVRSVAMQVGDSLPLHVGGAPRALLASLPTGERRAVVDELLAGGDQQYPVPPAADLDAELRATRDRGYARSDQDVTIGIAAFGSPVFNHRGELVAAVSISGLRERLVGREDELAALVVATAADISADLGFEGAGRG
ncbi:IclR family transcriptional regulator [Curtobacterium sp. MCPF17_002]|uniref:IclR family transcriptional regulator n=1 Tax=Curtobacterium sp. MCPF17_002 TaxID=2175645 RepID=UPI000DA93D1E|nr:IclR family transcriptional regulator [Curtobacterium sp. MCPF17_002]WIB77714.1 IclR family transcriptional regulator [Curtobacterium sp. MCPF17_002]